jgi:hypothetical protein
MIAAGMRCYFKDLGHRTHLHHEKISPESGHSTPLRRRLGAGASHYFRCSLTPVSANPYLRTALTEMRCTLANCNVVPDRAV